MLGSISVCQSKVGWKLFASSFSASNACFTRDEPSPKRVAGVGLGPKPPKLRFSWRRTQPRTAKATASIAVDGGKMIPRAAASCHRIILAACRLD